jgi:enoyl-CoA hydratase
MTDYENLLLSDSDGILTITINRESKLNALNQQTLDELRNAIQGVYDSRDIKGVIITGAGEKAFVAGADISEFANYNQVQGEELAAKGQRLLFDFIENLSKPVIAAINGFALGGGLELAMASHFRIASATAKMGLPEVSLGLIPGYGGTQRLAQLVGKGLAIEMITTASMIDAQKALDSGLVNHVVPTDQLLETAKSIAGKITKNSPVAISAALKAINANYQKTTNGYDVEIKAFGACFATQDFKEGTSAFLEKRKANFSGQ